MDNIHLELNEISPINVVDIDTMLSSFYSDNEDNDLLECMNILTNSMDEYETMTIRELLRISDYYNIPKSKKKEVIISNIIAFESDLTNEKEVAKRKKLWTYMRILKNDKYMKQFLFW